jgi:hypothetical protein
MALFIAPPAGPPHRRDRILSDTKSSALALKHQPFTRDQSNVQKAPVSFKSLPRNTVNQRMAIEQGIPNGREVIPLAHRVRAQARKVVRPLLRHCQKKHPDPGRSFDLDQCNCLPLAEPGYIMDWDDYFRQQAAMYRQLAQKTEDTFIKQELLDLAAACEEVANNIEDRRPSG